MTNNLTDMPDNELRDVLQQSRQVLTTLVQSLADRPDMQEAVRILMRPDDMLEAFSELAVKEPDMMRLVLRKLLPANHGYRNLESELAFAAHGIAGE